VKGGITMLTRPSPIPAQAKEPNHSRIPHYNRETLELSATIILENSCAGMSKKPKPIPVEQIAQKDLKLKIDYQVLSPDKSILSLMIFNKRTVRIYEGSGSKEKLLLAERGDLLIDPSLNREERELTFKRRFVIAHEIGHWFLHQSLHKPQSSLHETISSTEFNLLEWQADYWASCLLMPRTAVRRMFEEWLYRHKLSHSYLLGLQNSQNQNHYGSGQILQKLIASVADTFQVPVKVAAMRLYQLKLL